jgi:hypothetical protein
VAAGDLSVMEDPERAIHVLQRFLQSTIVGALADVTLDGLYDMAHEQPEVSNWIAKATARLQVGPKAHEPYRVRLAQVPTATSDILYNQVLHHIQTATRSAEPNCLQLMELTYSYRAQEVLEADPRGLARVLKEVADHASNPRLAEALRAWTMPPAGWATIDLGAGPGQRADDGNSPHESADVT